MISREVPQQGEPRGIDRRFPGCRPGVGDWYRAHSWRASGADGGCWFHSSLPPIRGRNSGRFDLEQPRGTCYWSGSEIAAARERLGRPATYVAHDEVAGAFVTKARFNPGHVADLLHPRAALHGVIQELSVSAPYALAQRWAAAFDAAGFDGISYQPRFSSEHAQALASFGSAGTAQSRGVVVDARPMADVLVGHGYTVVPAPHSSELTVEG